MSTFVRPWFGGRRGVATFAVLVAMVCVLLVAPDISVAQPSEKSFEIVPGSFAFMASTYQAGAHADWTTTFDFAHNEAGKTFNDVKNTVVELPAGFMGNANEFAFPRCTDAQLLGRGAGKAQCPVDSQIGTITVDLTLGHKPVPSTFPMYNMEVSSPGVTAELGFNAIELTEVLPVTVRPGDSGITVTAPNIEDIGEPHAVSVTIWGIPAAHEHDPERGKVCYQFGNEEGVATCRGGGEEAKISPAPFLANPTSCGMFTAKMKADSWEQPESWSEASANVGPVAECERVRFDPTIEALPTTNSAESSSGLDISLLVPQTWTNPFTIATSNLMDTQVTLPEGYTVNPSAGSGLAACTPTQFASEAAASLPGEGCPAESKLGSIEIETPVLAEKLNGAVYLAKPYENPFGTLLALYVVARAPERGIIIKVAGKIEPNPVTGQLVGTFDNTPQQPFSRFTLKFHQGATSPLVSSPTCGAYTVSAALTPWSAPNEPRDLNNSFTIEKGVHGGPCPSGGTPPFKPGVIAGTTNNAAGQYSPFYLRIDREDGEQEITKFTTVLPPGLTGNLSTIALCSDAQVETARHASGLQELNAPSCPVSSEIGHSLVGAGVGSVLAWTPGKVYLAGPYNGAELSLVSITSATVGPFDLGTVVIRFALRINPITAQVEVDSNGSDPIPHIIDGIVVHVREIHVYMDRERFTLNPTSCAPMSISETVTGAGANFANPSGQVPVNVSTPFQAADCANLAFKPQFKASASSKTSRANGAELTVKLVYPNAPQGTQANIRSVKVDLPKQLPSRLSTLQKACLNSVFNTNPAGCPAASRVGTASAITPILPVPLTGPAYFVSNGGAKFPELVIVLQGYGFTIDLHGETFISKAGITSSTFRTVPDQPVTSFQLTLPTGPNSALAANGNLCKPTRTVTQHKTLVRTIDGHKRTIKKTVHKQVSTTLQMPTAFTAQNGTETHQNTIITLTGCPKAKPAPKKSKH